MRGCENDAQAGLERLPVLDQLILPMKLSINYFAVSF